jgi:hypothetical protein
VGFAAAHLFRFDELPPGRGPTADLNDRPLRSPEQFVVSGIGVALQVTVEVVQKCERSIAASRFGCVLDRAMVRDVCPHPARAAMIAVGIQHLNRRIAGVHNPRGEDTGFQLLAQWNQHVGGVQEPAAERGSRDRGAAC